MNSEGFCRITYHRDGTVTYWSVYEQVWRRSARIPDRELAGMDPRTRERVLHHVDPFRGTDALQDYDASK